MLTKLADKMDKSQFMAAITYVPDCFDRHNELAIRLSEIGVKQVSFMPLVLEGRACGSELGDRFIENYFMTFKHLENNGISVYRGLDGHERGFIPYGGGDYGLRDLIVTSSGFITANRNVASPEQGDSYIIGEISSQKAII